MLEFFETFTGNLLAAEAAAGVGHHVALSVVGTERLPRSGYFRAKIAQAVGRVAVGSPLNGQVEIAGPEQSRMDEFFSDALAAWGDQREDRRQYTNDATISDWVPAKGYAFASTDKGNVSAQFYRDGKRPGDAILEWYRRMTQVTIAAKATVAHHYGKVPAPPSSARPPVTWPTPAPSADSTRCGRADVVELRQVIAMRSVPGFQPASTGRRASINLFSLSQLRVPGFALNRNSRSPGRSTTGSLVYSKASSPAAGSMTVLKPWG